MVKNELVPYLVKRLGLRVPGASMTLRFAGVGQSRIDQVMRENGKALDGVSASSTVSGAGRVDFSAAMKTHREEDWTRLKELKEQLIRQLGEFIYSEDGSTLEQTVLRRLDAGQRSLCLVEIASGGAVAASLSRAGARPGSLPAGFVAPTAREMGPLLGLSQASLDQAGQIGRGRRPRSGAGSPAQDRERLGTCGRRDAQRRRRVPLRLGRRRVGRKRVLREAAAADRPARYGSRFDRDPNTPFPWKDSLEVDFEFARL